MAIIIQLPLEIEEDLRRADPLLDDHARDLVLIANYEAGRLSTGDIAIVFGFSTRVEAEKWLADRGVCQNYSLEDLEDDRKTFDRIRGQV